jgi:hypothetical protein
MLDKTPLKSKKFMAYIISELTTKAGMFYMLMHLEAKLDWEELALLVAMLVSSSALTIGYVLGVAALEKYLHSAVEILDKDDKGGKKDDQEES